MTYLPAYALSGDAFHGPGQDNSLDVWWSALALGAAGLAGEITLDQEDWYCGPAIARLRLGEFLRRFGAACPLVVSLPPSTTATSAQVRALGALLGQAPRRHALSLICANDHAQALELDPAAAVQLYQLNRYGDPTQSATHQALGSEAALRRFPGLDLPGAADAQHLLLTEVRPSGIAAPVAWLVADFGNPKQHTPAALVLREAFNGAQREVVEASWSLGYSNLNNESQLTLQDADSADGPGLQWMFPDGSLYSGGGAVLREPVTGDFDARVGFSANGLSLGCALEMAAILIDPPPQGWTETDRQKLSPVDSKASKKVSLIFDVHGTPPYVSSECDENNGFRIGWNRSYTLTEFVSTPARAPISSNLYNRYGANVPQPPLGLSAVHGELRLVRRRGFFAAYYRLAGDSTWWCSGTVWNEQMPPQVYLRLAAKHWKKTDRAPAMTARFFNFELLSPTQRAP